VFEVGIDWVISFAIFKDWQIKRRKVNAV
jgi:hypothetical protein